MRSVNILGIESSCDETSVAIVRDGVQIVAQEIASQIALHHRFGGVVPEIAARKSMETIIPILEQVMLESGIDFDDIEAIAVTIGPGLIGSLLVGVSVAKALCYVKHKPLIPINHIEGHIKAIFLTYPHLEFPFIALVVSGGHTSLFAVYGHTDYEFLGGTRDDAAGEAFDKVAKILQLGYPGGPVIDHLAKAANPAAVQFPRAYLEKDSFDFSFSGLKTAVLQYVRSQTKALARLDAGSSAEIFPKEVPPEIADIAASFQEAVVDILVAKAISACRYKQMEQLVVVGGVASNSRLRSKMEQGAQKLNVRVYYPPPLLCTDNAAMIASAGYFRKLAGNFLEGKEIFPLNPMSNLPLGG
ncbi:MAG: tRNA (adenosine(37)-N6)-threonylcarbamoyltransferase complex transferase subunit TsaD [bacterium]|nr:tRNA (adenosine(37)-N6)-threonylcarbamoyltransferase complex transferase subunit TsaD [bacterium]